MRFPLPVLSHASLLAACALSAMPALAQDKGYLMLEFKIRTDLKEKILAMEQHHEKVSVSCDVALTPGPVTASYYPVDYLGKNIPGAIQGLASENPRFTFKPFAVLSERKLKYLTTSDSTVELHLSLDIKSDNPERLPLKFSAGRMRFKADEYAAFKKMVETQGAKLSVGSTLFEKVTYAPLAAPGEATESKGAGAVETKKTH